MKAILTTLCIGSLLFCTSVRAADACCPPAPGKDSKVTASHSAENARKVSLRVTGMTCNMCATSVENALKKVDGVQAAEVNLRENLAIVTVDAAKVKAHQLIAAVDKAGGDRHTFKAEEATDVKAKSPQIFCEGKSAGQLCGEGTVNALKLSGEKKVAWAEATKRYNAAVEAATKQLLQDGKATLSPEEAAAVEKWFAKGINNQINQQLAKDGN
jgi:copper chaperone